MRQSISHQKFVKFSLLAILLLPTIAFAQTVVRGPYLQTATPDSVIIKWRTDVAIDSAVGYALADGTPFSSSSPALVTDHEVTLTGLSPDTLYNYTIGSTVQVLAGGDLNSNGDGEHFFTTSPVSGTDKPTRVWVIGDSGTADANAVAVRNGYKSFTGNRETDVWLMLGDNAYTSGTDAQYQAAVFDTYPQLLRQTPLWSALGNHDAIDMIFNAPGAYPQIFSFPTAGESGGVGSGSENYYSFNYGNIHFISLDSSINANRVAGSAMWTWLEADLITNTQNWTIAFWHHPHYSKGSHDSDAEIALQEMRQNALPLLEAYGVDLILTGHSHSYERSYLVDGHSGQSGTLTPAMILDGGDGREFGDGAYIKPGPAGTPAEGAVHAVVGSSGKTEAEGTLNHPVMYTSMLSLGSMVLDVSGHQLDAAFIDSTGVVLDEFSIIKAPPQMVAIDIDPWSEANEIKPASVNLVPVAVLGTSVAAGDAVDFDASQVDPATVKIGLGQAPNSAYPWVMDVDGDTNSDMVVGFNAQEAGIVCGDTELSIEGETLDGAAFIGADSFVTTDCTDTGCHP
jgi:hypothetical protein